MATPRPIKPNEGPEERAIPTERPVVTEEYASLGAHPTKTQEAKYLDIQNAILQLWIKNPSTSLSEGEAIKCAGHKSWCYAAKICYERLVRQGNINYVCVDGATSCKPAPTLLSRNHPGKTVVVIGAGMAGLGCARQLEGLSAHFENRFLKMGEEVPKVVVLEARDRVGGRVFSRGFKCDTSSSRLGDKYRCTVEMGSMTIPGFDRCSPYS
ncbi:hypothetical protein V500_04964 [Pseudogymnoascus sp. VKM F-4518 (FW-2643)]|nr:hypothetical protein V500_04964 [Pseudogymnoascus sp. VKM F-4518 (FW-2643)]